MVKNSILNKHSFRKVFKALGNDTRLKIVVGILRSGEVACQELQQHFPLSQPAMSHHFRLLDEAGLLVVRKQGTAHFYRINQEWLRHHGVSTQKLIKNT